MKTVLLLLASLSASACAEESIIPVAYGKDRYEAMARKSPFALETKPEPPPSPVVDPFANVVLKGLGTDYVILQDHGAPNSIRLVGSQTNGGFTVKRVNWSEIPGQTTVVVTKEGVEGIVRFNANDIRTAALPPNTKPNSKGYPPMPGAMGSKKSYFSPSAKISSGNPSTMGFQAPGPKSLAAPQMGGSSKYGTSPGSDALGTRKRSRGNSPGGSRK